MLRQLCFHSLQSIAHEIQIIQGEPATTSEPEPEPSPQTMKQEPIIVTESKSAFGNLQNQQFQIITDTGDVQEQIEIESSVSSII